MYCVRARIWKGDIFVADIEELENLDASEICAGRLNASKVLIPENGENHIHNRRRNSQIVRRRSDYPKMHFDTGPARRRRGIQRWSSRRIGRVSTNRHVNWWQWSQKRFLDDRWKLLLSSSRRTQSWTPRAEERDIPNTTAIHWHDQENTYDLGCVARKPDRWLLELSLWSKFIGPMDQCHAVHKIEWKSSRRIFVVRWAADKNTVNDKWSGMSLAAQRREKAAMGHRRAEARQWANVQRHLFYWSRW